MTIKYETVNDIIAERDALRAEVERLTGCLKRANDQAEHFERHWYLRGDEVEALRADAERLRDENAALAGERLAERLKEAEAAAQAGRVEMLTALEKVRRDVGSLVQERDALRALNSMLRADLQSTKDALRAEVESQHQALISTAVARDDAREEVERLRAEVESLTQQLKAGESFHAVAVQQRDAAWRETESLRSEVERLRAPSVTCPACGSDANERDELTKAEREIERLRADLNAAQEGGT